MLPAIHVKTTHRCSACTHHPQTQSASSGKTSRSPDSVFLKARKQKELLLNTSKEFAIQRVTKHRTSAIDFALAERTSRTSRQMIDSRNKWNFTDRTSAPRITSDRVSSLSFPPLVSPSENGQDSPGLIELPSTSTFITVPFDQLSPRERIDISPRTLFAALPAILKEIPLEAESSKTS